MDKRLLGIGLILLIVGLVLSFSAAQSVQSVLPNPNNTQTERAIIAPHSIGYAAVDITNSSFVSVQYTSINATDFYIVNSTVFEQLEPLIIRNESITNQTNALEGNGVLFVMRNQTKGGFPYYSEDAGIIPQPNYMSPNVTVISPGTYYFIFVNDANYTNLVLYSDLVRSINSIGIAQSSFTAFGVIGDILVLAGLVACVYSLFSRGNKKAEMLQQEVDKMYSQIDKKAPRKRTSKRKKSTSRKSKKSRR